MGWSSARVIGPFPVFADAWPPASTHSIGSAAIANYLKRVNDPNAIWRNALRFSALRRPRIGAREAGKLQHRIHQGAGVTPTLTSRNDRLQVHSDAARRQADDCETIISMMAFNN